MRIGQNWQRMEVKQMSKDAPTCPKPDTAQGGDPNALERLMKLLAEHLGRSSFEHAKDHRWILGGGSQSATAGAQPPAVSTSRKVQTDQE